MKTLVDEKDDKISGMKGTPNNTLFMLLYFVIKQTAIIIVFHPQLHFFPCNSKKRIEMVVSYEKQVLGYQERILMGCT